jgi:hypothetical protein
MASTCKTHSSANMSSLWSLFLTTCRVSSTGTLVKRLNIVEANEGIQRLEVFQTLTSVRSAPICEGFLFSGRSPQYVMEITSQDMARGNDVTHCRAQTKFKNPLILGDIHHHQNILETTQSVCRPYVLIHVVSAPGHQLAVNQDLDDYGVHWFPR